jgi:hypothetical protein
MNQYDSKSDFRTIFLWTSSISTFKICETVCAKHGNIYS